MLLKPFEKRMLEALVNSIEITSADGRWLFARTREMIAGEGIEPIEINRLYILWCEHHRKVFNAPAIARLINPVVHEGSQLQFSAINARKACGV